MSSFGRLYRVTTCGESHSGAVSCIIEGVPPGILLDSDRDIMPQLRRRKPGQSAITTSRQEEDVAEVYCGVEQGFTLGTPVGIMVRNKDMRPKDYCFQGGASSSRNEATTSNPTEQSLSAKFVPRPSHADYTYLQKYNGFTASSGGGRASARETVCHHRMKP